MLTLTPGESVVVLRETRNAIGTGNITRTTIDRVLNRDVVLSNGQRFNKHRLQINNGTWDTPTQLLHPDHPRVRRAMAANRLQRQRNEVHRAIEKALGRLRQNDVTGAIAELCAVTEVSP